MAVKAKLGFDPKTFLSKVGNGAEMGKFQGNEAVFSQGDRADSVYYIQKGRIKLTVVSKQGKECVIALLGPGSFFGEGCLAGQSVRMATAIAMNECALARLEKSIIVRVIHQEPTFSEMFMSYLLSRNIRIEEDLVDQLFNSSEKRLARILLLLANFGHDTKAEIAIPKISQKTLAEMVGTTRSRISFFMNKFRTLGFIDYGTDNALEVHNSLLNVVLHD